MSAKVIISYDGTSNDDDALALGKMLARAGFTLALAYVRHSREFNPRREELAQHDADQRLERGAALLGDPKRPAASSSVPLPEPAWGCWRTGRERR